MSNIFLYDGKFSSLLVLIVYIIKFKYKVFDIKSKKNYIPNLLDEPVCLKLDNKEKILALLKKELDMKILYRLYYVFLSNNNNKEMIIYDFIKNALIYKRNILYRRNIDSVNKVLKLSNTITKEAHRIKGFLRFKKMVNFYFAEINPTNNVIMIIANHFKKRLSGEYWIIKDINRNIYAIYDLNKVIYLEEENILELNLDLDKKENSFEELWKSFFKTISIKERENPRCQMSFMPKKYWKCIIEMEDKI